VFRSQVRPSGVRFQRLLAAGVHVPVLQVHGELDGCLAVSTARGSERYAHAGHRLEVLDGVGHFPHQEDPARVNALLLAQAA
jgi:pimeloyl-ACP methyl ester carboxylesterase